jgi:hypothetical protein
MEKKTEYAAGIKMQSNSLLVKNIYNSFPWTFFVGAISYVNTSCVKVK